MEPTYNLPTSLKGQDHRDHIGFTNSIQPRHSNSSGQHQSLQTSHRLTVFMTINVLFKTHRIKAKVYNADSMQTLLNRVSNTFLF